MDEKILQIVLKARDEASKTLEGVGKSAGGAAELLSKSFTNAAIVSGAAVAGLVLEARSAIMAFNESQLVVSQTEAVLKSTSGAAGMTADAISYLAGRMQRLTGISDETIQTGENMLLTFTSIGKDIFPQATETMLNMSVAMGTDVKGSAIQLGKALNDPILGVSALRRVGVQFNDSQQETIKKLVESGKLMDAQKMILKELEVEFGGSARAAGQTFVGQLNVLKESFGGLQEGIGEFLTGAIGPIIPKFQEVVDAITEITGGEGDLKYLTEVLTEQFGAFGEALGKTIEFFGTHKEALIALAGVLGGVLSLSLIAATGAMLSFIGLSAPVLLIAGAIGAVGALIMANWGTIGPVLMPVIEMVKGFFQSMADGIMNFVTVNMPTFQAIWAVLVNLIQYGLAFISGLWNTVWPSIMAVFKGIWESLVGIFKVLWGSFQLVLSVGLGLLTGDWKKAWDLMKSGFMNIFDGIKTFAKGWWDSIVGMFRGGLNTIVGTLNGFIGVINKAGSGVGVNIPSIPSFDNGGFVQNTGLAMVHQGEFVMSRDMLSGRTGVPSNVTTNNTPISIEAIINTPLDLDALGYQLAWQYRNG